MEKHIGKTREDGVGNGQAAWKALEKKCNSNTKEARRAYHEYLHSAKMKSGDDPDDFLYTMDGYRERLKDMDRGRQQHHQVSLLRQSETPPEKLCRLDSGPVQRWKSANDSFNTVRALEKESRRRWQVDVMLVPQVHHAQRRDMPQATTANGQQR